MKNEKKYYSVPEWSEIDDIRKAFEKAPDGELYALEETTGQLCADAISCIDMQEYQISQMDSDEKANAKEFALVHMLARTRALVALHGSIRGAMRLPPVFTAGLPMFSVAGGGDGD